MAKQNIDELKKLVDHTFKRQTPMLSLYQTLAEHFYPERADFTFTRNVGVELADSLVDSYPVLARRDLANSFSAMLRDGDWFNVGIDGTADHNGKQWLQWSTGRLRRLINNRSANFVRATKEGDHDYATFGQAVISVEMNRKGDGLLFRDWHLRDCAWWEDETGKVSGVVRKWGPTYRQLVDYFGEKKVSKNILDQLHKEPFKEVQVRHIVMPSNMYGDDEIESKHPFVSVYIDIANDVIIEEVGINHKMYVVPRFQTISGSAYAYSPATVVALPDARALQAMTHTLLEAGERYARPPIVATAQVIQGDADLSPDGITYIDKEYDERLGAALRPLSQDRGGFPIGMELRNNCVNILTSAFYLNKISLPDFNREVTAYEIQERMKQYRRENLPLFSPIESEYNGQLCETAFEIAMSVGLLGSPYDIPESLRNKDVVFKFESPLTQSEEEKKVSQFNRVSQMLAEASQLDPSVKMNIDFDIAFRDAVGGMDAPATWLRKLDEVANGRKMVAAAQAAQAAQEQGGAAQ